MPSSDDGGEDIGVLVVIALFGAAIYYFASRRSAIEEEPPVESQSPLYPPGSVPVPVDRPPISPQLPQPGQKGGVGDFDIPADAKKKLTPKQLNSLSTRLYTFRVRTA